MKNSDMYLKGSLGYSNISECPLTYRDTYKSQRFREHVLNILEDHYYTLTLN